MNIMEEATRPTTMPQKRKPAPEFYGYCCPKCNRVYEIEKKHGLRFTHYSHKEMPTIGFPRVVCEECT